MSIARYEEISDDTMDSLVDSLETLVDVSNDRRNEVEYSVRIALFAFDYL